MLWEEQSEDLTEQSYCEKLFQAQDSLMLIDNARGSWVERLVLQCKFFQRLELQMQRSLKLDVRRICASKE